MDKTRREHWEQGMDREWQRLCERAFVGICILAAIFAAVEWLHRSGFIA